MLHHDDLIDLSTAAKLLPNRPHTATLWRWCRVGVKARSGQRVRLEHVRYGGKIFTTAEALDRLGRDLAEADAAHFAEVGEAQSIPSITSARTEAQRQREIAAAEKRLSAAGI